MSDTHNLRENVSAILNGNNVVVKVLSCGIVLCYFLTLVPNSSTYLALTPAHILPQNYDKFWTLFTSWMVEFHWWLALGDILLLILYGKLLEPVWGASKILMFYFGVNMLSGLVTCFIFILHYYATYNEEFIFETYVNGQMASIAGFTVLVKQQFGNDVVVTTKFGKLLNRDIPLISLASVLLFSLIGILPFSYFILFAFGMFFSWVYLRFYQRHSNGKRGDFSSGMAFASFFPSRIQPMIAFVGNKIFDILVRFNVCRKPADLYNLSNLNRPLVVVDSDMSTSQYDESRRKERAVRDLNERLKRTKEETTNWDAVDEPNQQQFTGVSVQQNEEVVETTAPIAASKNDTLPPKPILVRDIPESIKSASGSDAAIQYSKVAAPPSPTS